IRYHDSKGRRLAHVRPIGQPYGWPRRNLFFQPLMEAVLRRGIERFDHVRLISEVDITHLSQDASGVDLSGKAGTDDLEIRARYVVGADGGRSFVRGAVGLELTGKTAPSKWLVVDVEHDTWDALYSAVYCDPKRPAMTIPLPYGYRRFEFKLLEDETEEQVVEDDLVNSLLAPYYRGRAMPTINRRRVYWHHSRIASRFQSGRAFLAGDAAHLQPPFFGQGMNSGIRDATNLAWKLAAVTAGRADESILATYDSERREHAENMVAFATRVGDMYQPRNYVTEAIRDTLFRGVQKIPGARDYILQMKYKPTPRYVHGVVVGSTEGRSSSPVGRAFTQPWVQNADGGKVKLDDAVGNGFSVIAIGSDPAEHLNEADRAFWREAGATLVHLAPSRTGQRELTGNTANTTNTGSTDQAESDTVTLYDIDGAFRDLLLERPQDEVFVLRPDRYVAAAGTVGELASITDALRKLLAVRPAFV
ncbi:MAG: putative 3-(3-hydroxy-phenyl)propionate hydroxylase, FAD/NAD(P)-binding, partial [Pseudonocardiales bacterium]|nr:putative 3-(3-hydroxy-phenyl)propionate hydroxylase, FAD/NAD(P)-binding [Pseudonocardiales bacterium]